MWNPSDDNEIEQSLANAIRVGKCKTTCQVFLRAHRCLHVGNPKTQQHIKMYPDRSRRFKTRRFQDNRTVKTHYVKTARNTSKQELLSQKDTDTETGRQDGLSRDSHTQLDTQSMTYRSTPRHQTHETPQDSSKHVWGPQDLSRQNKKSLIIFSTPFAVNNPQMWKVMAVSWTKTRVTTFLKFLRESNSLIKEELLFTHL